MPYAPAPTTAKIYFLANVRRPSRQELEFRKMHLPEGARADGGCGSDRSRDPWVALTRIIDLLLLQKRWRKVFPLKARSCHSKFEKHKLRNSIAGHFRKEVASTFGCHIKKAPERIDKIAIFVGTYHMAIGGAFAAIWTSSKARRRLRYPLSGNNSRVLCIPPVN